jgi:hypothetical protein
MPTRASVFHGHCGRERLCNSDGGTKPRPRLRKCWSFNLLSRFATFCPMGLHLRCSRHLQMPYAKSDCPSKARPRWPPGDSRLHRAVSTILRSRPNSMRRIVRFTAFHLPGTQHQFRSPIARSPGIGGCGRERISEVAPEGLSGDRWRRARRSQKCRGRCICAPRRPCS